MAKKKPVQAECESGFHDACPDFVAKRCGCTCHDDPVRILTVGNINDGTRAVVSRIEVRRHGSIRQRYRVVFTDTDADETIGTYFNTDREAAIERAKALIAGRAS